MASLLWRQVSILLYRNFHFKLRTKSQSIQEIALPIYFVVLLVILKLFAYKPTSFPELPNETNASLSSFPLANNTVFYVAPDFSEAERVVNRTLPGSTYRMFSSLADMDNAYKSTPNPNGSPAIGIYFINERDVMEYALRFPYSGFPSSVLFSYSETSCRNEQDSFSSIACPANQYLSTGFASLQVMLDTEIIKMYNENYSSPEVIIQRMPKPGTVSNGLVFKIVTSLYLVLAMSPFLTFLLVNVVTEKQRKIREAMKMMGLDNLALWLSWSITYSTMILVMTLVMTLISVFGQLFPKSNFLLVFLIYFFYGLSVEMLGFMLTTFLNNARTSGAVGSFLSLILGLLYFIIAFGNINVQGAWALSLLSPTGFAIGIDQLSQLELTADGAQFYNLWEGPYPLAISLIMLLVDTFLYFLLTLYLDIVIPGEYGQRQPFYFFLLPSFWFPSKYGKLTTQVDIQSCQVNEDIESISDDLKGKEAIKIKNLSKLYEKRIFSDNTKSTLAVNKFSLDIYEGQITALLGHNGAGKTTLFNILTGFVDATSGSATVFNYDVSNTSHMAKIRQMTGVCPQHNILIDVLSVKEHLKIFAGIKGIHPSKVDNEITRVVKLIGLEDQMDTFSKNLSGGQKRKLSVGIAIMGDPKILILDEPTAGMDPYSRHSLWDLLRSRKEGKVTLLTTHFMDEADILADRKAIISKGQLRCVGSSLFLKTRYGAGYHLGVVTKVAGDNSSVTSCVKKHIGGAELVRSSGFELGYTLPIVEVDKFADLFGDLEKDSDELGIQNFGVSMTTLEEVFLKIGEEDEVEDAPTPDENGTKAPLLSSSSAIRERYSSTTAVCYVNPNFKNKDQEREAIEIDIANNCGFDPTISKVGEPSKLRTYFALVKKQAIVYTRNPGIIVFGLLFPIGLAIGSAAVLNLQIQTDNSDDPPLVPLSLQLNSLYASPTSPFLYKNSTGQPLDNFANISGVSFQLSDLNDFLTVPDRFSYTAADIFQFNSTQMSFKALYNTTAVHSLPSVLNLMSQSVLSTINQTASLITTYNKRWPALTPQSAFNGGLFGGTLMAALAVVLSSGLSAINPVQERELKIKSQLRVSGVQFNLYWLAPLFVDYLWYLCIAIAFLIGLGAFGVSAFITGGALAALILLLVGCGFSCIFTSYCASFIFDKYETASSVWPTIIQLVSLFPYLIVSLVDQLGSPDIAIVFNAIFVLINPYYVAFSGIFYISKVYTKYVTMNSADNIPASVYFDWSYPMIPLSVLMPYIHVVILYWLLKVIDVKHSGGKISDVFNTGKKRHDATVRDTSMFEPEEENGIDDDVLEESRKVKEIVNNQTYNQHEPVVLIHNLRKEYVKRKEKKFFQKQKEEEKVKVAVSNLSLSVYPGDVLGLLGPNGAGKTTAMNVLIAETGPTKGKVFVSGHNVQSSLSKAFQGMGYCSQDNPLWEVLTIREHLTLFAVARGVTNIQPTIDSYVDALDIREHLDKRAKTLSGGTKRKLCFAMALLGNPQVVLLDEPSTGMDPKTKRFMWNTISSAFQGTNRGAILTTHYMDEADALCSKVAIMVLGKLKCIGSTQHLKSKFGQGYILEIKMKRLQEAGDDSLHRFICEMFQSVSEPERFSHRYVYKVAQDSVVSLSSVFGELEQAKESLGIEEYSFSQSTLEQVFLQFAREQEEREDERETT